MALSPVEAASFFGSIRLFLLLPLDHTRRHPVGQSSGGLLSIRIKLRALIARACVYAAQNRHKGESVTNVGFFVAFLFEAKTLNVH